MMRIMLATLTLLASAPAIAGVSKFPAFIDICKTEARGDIKDKLGLRQLKIDRAGFCVCVGLALDKIVSDDEALALAGKPLTETFLNKLEVAQGLCRVLMIDAVDQVPKSSP